MKDADCNHLECKSRKLETFRWIQSIVGRIQLLRTKPSVCCLSKWNGNGITKQIQFQLAMHTNAFTIPLESTFCDIVNVMRYHSKDARSFCLFYSFDVMLTIDYSGVLLRVGLRCFLHIFNGCQSNLRHPQCIFAKFIRFTINIFDYGRNRDRKSFQTDSQTNNIQIQIRMHRTNGQGQLWLNPFTPNEQVFLL